MPITKRACWIFVLMFVASCGASRIDQLRDAGLTSFAYVLEGVPNMADNFNTWTDKTTVWAPNNKAFDNFLTRLRGVGINVNSTLDLPEDMVQDILEYHFTLRYYSYEDLFSAFGLAPCAEIKPGMGPPGSVLRWACNNVDIATDSGWPGALLPSQGPAIPIDHKHAPWFYVSQITEVLIPKVVAERLEDMEGPQTAGKAPPLPDPLPGQECTPARIKAGECAPAAPSGPLGG